MDEMAYWSHPCKPGAQTPGVHFRREPNPSFLQVSTHHYKVRVSGFHLLAAILPDNSPNRGRSGPSLEESGILHIDSGIPCFAAPLRVQKQIHVLLQPSAAHNRGGGGGQEVASVSTQRQFEQTCWWGLLRPHCLTPSLTSKAITQNSRKP
jgi:hypothetical protein